MTGGHTRWTQEHALKWIYSVCAGGVESQTTWLDPVRHSDELMWEGRPTLEITSKTVNAKLCFTIVPSEDLFDIWTVFWRVDWVDVHDRKHVVFGSYWPVWFGAERGMYKKGRARKRRETD